MTSSSMITDPPQMTEIETDPFVIDEKSREQYPAILSRLLMNSEEYAKEDCVSLLEAFYEASNMAVDKIKELAETVEPKKMTTFITNYVSKTLLSDLFKHERDFYACLVVNAAIHTATATGTGTENDDSDSDSDSDSYDGYGSDSDSDGDTKFVGLHKVCHGTIDKSFMVPGVAFKNTLSYVLPLNTVLRDPKILLLDIYHPLDDPQSDKVSAEIRFISRCSEIGATIILSTSTFSDTAKKFLEDQGLNFIGLVPRDDLHRVALAFDARVVKSSSSLVNSALGAPKDFMAMLVQNEVFNIFRGCSSGKTATIVVYDADKFTMEEEEILHDEIRFVRSALKDSTVVNGKEIYRHISRYLKQEAQKVGGKSQKYMDIFANALEIASEELPSDSTFVLEPAVLKIDAVTKAALYIRCLL